MKQLMGIINDTKDDSFLKDLTIHRSLASVPFGARYRMIDFILSNMVNSGIINIGILLQNKNLSLMDHLGPGQEWDLDRKREGLFLLTPNNNYSTNHIVADNLNFYYANLDYLKKSRQKFVIIASSNAICNLNLQEVYQKHLDQKIDITIVSHNYQNRYQGTPCTFLKTDEDNQIIDIKVNPDKGESLTISTGIYLLAKDLLIEIIDSCISRGRLNLVKDGFIPRLNQLKITAYPHKGYLGIINSLENYYQTNMDLLQENVRADLFNSNNPIYTKVKDEPPVKYCDNSFVKNSILANGCIIEGHVENSIVFRGVQIKKNAHVYNSIIMQKSTIEENALVRNAILDKNVTITQNKEFTADIKYPILVRKKAVI